MKSNDARGILQKGRVVEVSGENGGGPQELEEGAEGFSEKTKARFWSRVNKIQGGCWLWTGGLGPRGYGVFYLSPKCGLFKTRSQRAHRVSWALHNGKIPDGLCVLHRCDNIVCVNPDHLFLGTQLENIADREAKGRAAIGSRNGKSKLTERIVLAIRARYVKGTITHKQLADEYGVRESVITNIINHKRWTHLP